ncbi:MAG: DUF4262 domain-containing protein [Candidatus Phosphoribacter sp.]
MTSWRARRALRRIRRNIKRSGYHLYVIIGTQDPNYAYTIGLTDRNLPELVLAGCVTLHLDEVATVMKSAVAQLAGPSAPSVVEVPGIGNFLLGPVHDSWITSLLLGLRHYYQERPTYSCRQLVPATPALQSYDTPDMSISMDSAPMWSIEERDWELPIPFESMAIVDLSVARGEPVTQCSRSDETTWRMWAEDSFALTQDDTVVVSMGTLLAYDPGLEFTARMPVDSAVSRRNPEGEWREAEVTEERD